MRTKENTIKWDDDNPKTGGVTGISITPLYSCPKDAPCFIDSLKAIKEGKRPICYYLRGNYFEGGTIKNGLQNDSKMKKALHNWIIYRDNPEDYFKQIEEKALLLSFFRYHDGGDIPNREYLEGMIRTAKKCKKTTFTAYTKQYNLINNYIMECGKLPKNLIIIFSKWESYPMNNPFSLPVFTAVKAEELPDKNSKTNYICPCSYKTHKEHTCKDCIKENKGCYFAKKYQTIFEKLH